MSRFKFILPEAERPIHGATSEEETLASALGETIIWFNALDGMISTAISFMLRRGDDVGRIVTCALSFRGKLNLFEALFRGERPGSPRLEELRDLCAACAQVEELRNQQIHSAWLPDFFGIGKTRLRYTARGKHGLREHFDVLTTNQIRAIWVHCGSLTKSVDDFMFEEFGSEYGSD